jgi:hypothetical protein
MHAIPGGFAVNGFPLMEFDRKPIDKHLMRGFALAWTSELRLQKLRPSIPGDVTIASMQAALTSAGKVFPLITIHPERAQKGICYVGRMLRTSQRTLTILSISPEAEWDGEDCYSLRDITLLEFGTAYEKLLTQMARPSTTPPASA